MTRVKLEMGELDGDDGVEGLSRRRLRCSTYFWNGSGCLQLRQALEFVKADGW